MKTLKKIGIVFGGFAGLIFLYLTIIIFAPGFSIPEQPIQYSKNIQKGKSPSFRKNVSINLGGTKISAWLYLPENKSIPVPCVIMSHGFGGTKGVILEKYALRYRKEGLAVITYDFRHFGESGGVPRQLYSQAYQIEDLKAVIKYVRGRKEINPDKIALWGTSAAGGYGLLIAARDKRIACIVGQCPSLDHEADGQLYLKQMGFGHFLRLIMHAQRDKGRSRFGLSDHMIPIVGKPGTFAFQSSPGAFDGYSRFASTSIQPGFQNKICARILFMPEAGNPIAAARDVRSPVLLQISKKDNWAPPEAAYATAKILGKYAEVKEYPTGHFGIYYGKHYDKAVVDQINFFKKHLY